MKRAEESRSSKRDIVESIGESYLIFRRPIRYAAFGGAVTAMAAFAVIKNSSMMLACILTVPAFLLGCIIGVAFYCLLKFGMNIFD